MAPTTSGRDVLSREARSALMSRIRGKNTSPEVKLRKALFALGVRYRLHSPDIPGRPDIVFPRHRAVVLVNGCFWHGHRCHLFKWPRSNSAFWRQKIAKNRRRDRLVLQQLDHAGWRAMVVWECSIRKAGPDRFAAVAESVRGWLLKGSAAVETHRTRRRSRLPSMKERHGQVD